MIDKIIERLEAERKRYYNIQTETAYSQGVTDGMEFGFKKSSDIVKQVAAEENNGWISVNKNPNKSDDYLVYYHKKYDSTSFETNWHGICSFIESSGGWQTEEGETILAWQPLPQPPQPYKEG